MTSTVVPMSRLQFRSVREARGRVNLWQGAIRSGKTVSSLLRWLLFVRTAPRGGELVVIGRTRESIGRNVFGPLQDPSLFGAMAKAVKYTTGASTAIMFGRVVHVIGASDAKAEKVIRGMTVAGAYVDELTVIPEEFFTQLLGRMSVPGAQCFATTNPDSPGHWVKRKFLDRMSRGELPDWRTWRFTLDDNPSLTAKYKRSVRTEFTGLWRRRFILGEWVAAEGAVYGMWDPERHVVPWDTLPRMTRLLAVGMDHGTTNATAALMLGLGVDDALYLVDEWRYDPALTNTRLANSQLSTQFREWLTKPHLPHPEDHGLAPQWVAVDPAAASMKAQLHGDRVPGLVDADNDVQYGIPVMASLLAEHDLRISDRCHGFALEAPGYSWDPKSTEKGKDSPIKVADHSLDGGRYAVVTTESYWRDAVKRRADRRNRGENPDALAAAA